MPLRAAAASAFVPAPPPPVPPLTLERKRRQAERGIRHRRPGGKEYANIALIKLFGAKV